MKIYLCKSNNCDPNIIARVRNIFSDNYEVLEHKGGVYNPELIKQANVIIFIPPINAHVEIKDNYTNKVLVGRGQFGEIANNKQLAFVFFYVDEQAQFKSIKGGEKINEGKSWQEYGYILFSNHSINFIELQTLIHSIIK